MRARKLWPLVVAEKAQRDHLKFLEEREEGGPLTEPLTKQQVGDVVVVDGHAAEIGVGQDGHTREDSFETEASEEYARREFEREKHRKGDVQRGNYTGTPTEEKAFYPPTNYEQAHNKHPYVLKPGGGGAMAGVGANGHGRHNFPTSPSAASLQLQQRAAADSYASDLGGTTLVDRSRENSTPVGEQAGHDYGRNPYGQGEGIPSGSFAEIPLTTPVGARGGGRAY